MPETAVEQMREAIEDGIVFTPPWLGDVLLEIVARLEALERGDDSEWVTLSGANARLRRPTARAG